MASTRSTSKLSPQPQRAWQPVDRAKPRRRASLLALCALGALTIAWLGLGLYGGAWGGLSWLPVAAAQQPAFGAGGMPAAVGGQVPGVMLAPAGPGQVAPGQLVPGQ